MDEAVFMTMKADIFIIIGSSLEVYPAAGLVQYAPEQSEKYLIDPHAKEIKGVENLTIIKKTAVHAVPELVKKLIESHV